MLKASYYTEPTEVDKLIFEKLVPPTHSLRQVKQGIDFERFREPVTDGSSPAQGRGAEDPVRPIKLEFLQFQYQLSDREVVAQAQVNVAFRYFLDLALASGLPVPSLLSQFRTRLGATRQPALFDQVVTQARAYGLIRDRLRLKDATPILANIAVPSTLAASIPPPGVASLGAIATAICSIAVWMPTVNCSRLSTSCPATAMRPGLPCGSAGFIQKLGILANRLLAYRPQGRPKRAAHNQKGKRPLNFPYKEATLTKMTSFKRRLINGSAMSLTSITNIKSNQNAMGNGLGQVAPFRLSLMTVAVLVAVNAHAAKVNEPPPTVELAPLEIIGEKPSQLAHIPGSGFVIDKTTLDRQGPLSTKDAMRTIPGIHIVDEDVLGRRFNLGIRGLNPRRSVRTQLLEDGAPIQLAPYSDPSNHYIPTNKRIDHIEVLKGSGQIMYGPQTVGGAVNFVSAPIPEEFGGSISAASGNNGYYDTHLRLGGALNDFVGLSLDYIRQESGGNRSGQHQEVDDLALKALIKIDDRQRLMLKGILTHEDAAMGEVGLTSEMYRRSHRTNPLRNDSFEVRRYAGQALYEFDISDTMQFSTNIYGNHMFRESIRQANDSSQMNNCANRREPISAEVAPSCGNEQRPRTYNVFGIEPKLVFIHDAFGVQSETTLGIRGHFEWADRERYVGNAGPRDTTQGREANNHGRNRYQNNSLETQALPFFVQNRFFLGDFIVTPGVRVEHYYQDNINHIDDSMESLVRTEALPGVGVTYNGIDNTTLFSGVHRGFAPGRIGDFVDPTKNILSQVEPELSLNYEAGVRTSPTPGVNLEMTYFRIDFENQIVEDITVEDTLFVNVGETVHQGVETGFRLDSNQLFGTDYNYYLTTSYTYLDAYFASTEARAGIVKDNRLPYAPEHLINANVGIETPWGLDIRFGIQSVSQQYVDIANTREENANGQEGIIPGYTVFNVSANYQVVKNVNVFMNGYNLSDKKYIASRVDGINPGQGFQMMGGVKWTF